MRSGMHIGTIFNLYSFIRRLYKAPKFILHIVLGYERIADAIHRRVIEIRGRWRRWRMRGPPPSAELKITRLETRQTVFFSLIEAKIAAGAKETDVAKPLSLRNGGQRGVKTKDVEPCDNKVKHAWISNLGSECTTITPIA
jgi:hypothetical protein